MVQTEINNINRLSNYFIELNENIKKHERTKNPEELMKLKQLKITFLLKAHKFEESLKLVLSKTFDLNLEVNPEDFPKELTLRRM